MAKRDATAAEAALEAEVQEYTLSVRGRDGADELRLSDDDGKVSLVVRGPKAFIRKGERGLRFTMTLTPDAAETLENTVTVELPAEDAGGLPASAKEVKREK